MTVTQHDLLLYHYIMFPQALNRHQLHHFSSSEQSVLHYYLLLLTYLCIYLFKVANTVQTTFKWFI